jgi:hypothetical protein
MIFAIFCGTLFGIFPLANLHCANDRCHMVGAPAFTASTATDKAFVNLDRMLAPNRIAFGPDHT